MFIIESLLQALFSSVFLLGVGYIGYWCFRGARYTWAGLTARPVVPRPRVLSPRASRIFHFVAALSSIATVLVAGYVVMFLIALSGAEF